MQAEQRLHSEIAELQKQWDLVSKKLSRLEHDRILESNSEEKFRLEHRIAEVKAERQQIEQQLSDLEEQLEQHTKPSQGFHPSIPKVYHNLPQPDYGRFVGREQELAKVTRILRPYPHSQYPIVTVDGIGGIGKSALALEIAHRYLHKYDEMPPEERFDAIIWTSAKQTVLTAEGISTRRQVLRTLDDIYTAIAVALQREDITRASKEEQDEIVRNALTRQRTLLIADNLETVDDEAVMDFLRELPAPTKAIVTTRHRLDVAYPVRLTGMPWEDVKMLIEQECEKKEVVLDEEKAAEAATTNNNARHLFDRTGGVPLAIVWSIAQMGFGYSVEAVLSRLGEPTGDIARFCFEGAIEQIKGKPAHKLLMVVSLCADSASREALGYATGLPKLDRDDGLVELEKLSLVNKKGDRFSLLPLTKQFALSELNKSPDREHLQDKWIEYFRRLTEEYSGEYWNWRNYDWLLAEGNNILSIIDWAIANDHGEIALSFTRATKRYLDIKGRWSELVNYGEQLHTISQALNDEHTWPWICIHWLSWLYIYQGNTELAMTFARRGLSLYQDLNDVKGTCFATRSLGKVLRLTGRYEDDKEICEQAMNLAKEHNYGDGIAYIHMELGRLARDRGEWEESKMHWEAIVEWCEKHKDEADLDDSFLMSAIGELGWVEFHLGNYRSSKEHLERSLTFLERMGGRGITIAWHQRLANIEKALGNRERALQHAQEALFWAERLNMKRGLEETQVLLEEL